MKKEVRFLTNIFNLSAQEILNLYKMRWQIELFFKWIKQNLRIKHWIGRNENAIKIQLYSALIAYVLIRLIQEEINNKYSILKITRIIRVYITKKVNLLSVFITWYWKINFLFIFVYIWKYYFFTQGISAPNFKLE